MSKGFETLKDFKVKEGGDGNFSYYDECGNVKKELFNEIAEKEAIILAEAEDIDKARKMAGRREFRKACNLVEKGKLTTTQVRKFYDDLKSIEKQMELSNENGKREKFERLLPLIKMLRTKAFYAKARDNVTDHFVNFIERNISLVNTPRDLEQFSKYFESVLGFFRYYEEQKKQLSKQWQDELKREKRR